MEYTQYETQRSEVRFIICYQTALVILVHWISRKKGGGGGKGWRKYRDVCHALSKGLLTINQEKDNSKDCSHFFSTKHSQNGGGPRDYRVLDVVYLILLSLGYALMIPI